MKVKEYIEYLKTLNQERGIWVAYDFPCSMFEPIPDARASEDHVRIYGSGNKDYGIGVEEGDYIIEAG